MQKIYLIRHGDKEKTPGDPPLSPLGRQQAQQTSLYLKKVPKIKVYASPLRRTIETAQYIAEHHSEQIIVDQRLRERMNWGDISGQSFEEFLKIWDKTQRDRLYSPENGDSSYEAGQRMELFIHEAVEVYPNIDLAVVAHGGIISDFLLNIFEDVITRQFSSQISHNNVKIPECSVTIVTYDKNQFSLLCLAESAHLTDTLL